MKDHKFNLANIDTSDKTPGTIALEKIFDFDTLKIKIEGLSGRQKEFAHLIDPRFFAGKINPFRKDRNDIGSEYTTDLNLESDLYYLHPLMDPHVLEAGSIRRFPQDINFSYIREKYEDDKWVSEGNNEMANRVELFVKENLERLNQQNTIRILDIGPCGGSITSLMILRGLAKYGLLDKVRLALLDIAPNVLESTILGEFEVPKKMIEEYCLEYAGKNAQNYKQILANGVLKGLEKWYKQVGNQKTSQTDRAITKSNETEGKTNDPRTIYYRGDGESLPPELIGQCDIVVNAYTFHHINLCVRKIMIEQMAKSAKKGAFIGVTDMYEKSYETYMTWYKKHFTRTGDAPPIECPSVPNAFVIKNFEKNSIKIKKLNDTLERTFVFDGVKID